MKLFSLTLFLLAGLGVSAHADETYETLEQEYSTLAVAAVTSDFEFLEEASTQACTAYDPSGDTEPLLLRVLREVDARGELKAGGRQTLLMASTSDEYDDIVENLFVRLNLQARVLRVSKLEETSAGLIWTNAGSSLRFTITFRKSDRARLVGAVDSSAGPQYYLCLR